MYFSCCDILKYHCYWVSIQCRMSYQYRMRGDCLFYLSIHFPSAARSLAIAQIALILSRKSFLRQACHLSRIRAYRASGILRAEFMITSCSFLALLCTCQAVYRIFLPTFINANVDLHKHNLSIPVINVATY